MAPSILPGSNPLSTSARWIASTTGSGAAWTAVPQQARRASRTSAGVNVHHDVAGPGPHARATAAAGGGRKDPAVARTRQILAALHVVAPPCRCVRDWGDGAVQGRRMFMTRINPLTEPRTWPAVPATRRYRRGAQVRVPASLPQRRVRGWSSTCLEHFDEPDALVEVLDGEGFTRLRHVDDAPAAGGSSYQCVNARDLRCSIHREDCAIVPPDGAPPRPRLGHCRRARPGSCARWLRRSHPRSPGEGKG